MKHTVIEAGAAATHAALSSVRVPNLSAAAFCLTDQTREAIERAGRDRRMSRVKMELCAGGIAEARKAFEARRTPALLIVEVDTTGAALLAQLDTLADICDPETRVVVIGTENDIALYRTLMARGIAEYLVGALTPVACVAMVQDLFGQGTASKFGKVYAFVGAKGGVGSSTLAQNVAWTIAEEQASPTLLLDLDFRFGSAAVNYDVKPVMGLEKYIGDPDKLDAALLDRLSVQRGAFLSVLPGFEDPLGEVEAAPEAIERLIELARASYPHVVVDLPHEWTAACRDALTSADQVVVVATPDLCSLRNARALMERLAALRPNDARPRLLLNACRMARRTEIDAVKFARSLDVEACGTITFDPAAFGNAAAAGCMIREQAPRCTSQRAVHDLACDLTGRTRRPTPGRWRRMFGLG